MALKQLSLETLKDLDSGRASEAFRLHLRRAQADCEDRPADPEPRKVTLELELAPVLDDDGTCTEVTVRIKAKSSVPVHKTRVYSCGLRANGIVFNEDSPTNVNQATLLPEDEV